MIEKDEHLITYCRLYCRDCFGYKGTIADLAQDMQKNRFLKTCSWRCKYKKS